MESTRHPDTSAHDPILLADGGVSHAWFPADDLTIYSGAMKKILLLLALVGLAVFAAKKVKSS